MNDIHFFYNGYSIDRLFDIMQLIGFIRLKEYNLNYIVRCIDIISFTMFQKSVFKNLDNLQIFIHMSLGGFMLCYHQ